MNTGWVGGKYGVGSRMDLPSTRAIVDAIHDGSLANGEFENFPVFDMKIPKAVNRVDSKLLNPANSWDAKEFDAALKQIADAFQKNHKKYEAGCAPEINAAGPKY